MNTAVYWQHRWWQQPLTVSCSSKSRLVLPFWYQVTW